MRLAVLACAVVGCYSKPDFHGTDVTDGSCVPSSPSAPGVVLPHSGPITIQPNGGSVPAGFVVGVRFASGSTITTTRDAENVVWQRDPDGTFYIFFREALVSGDSITITPEC